MAIIFDEGASELLDEGFFEILDEASPGLNPVNQWAITDLNGYGPAHAAIGNATGNALVAFVAAGSDSQISGGAGYCPRLTVSDDAHNLWIFAGSAPTATPGFSRRIDIWICPNAKAATIVSVSSNIIYAGLAGIVCEIAGFPQWAQVDFVLANEGVGTTWTLSGTANSPDFVLGAGFYFGFTPTGGTIVGPAGATYLNFANTSSSLTDVSQIDGYSFYYPAQVAAGAVTYTQSWTTSGHWAAVMVGFKASPSAPASGPNPNMPSVKVEAAFGWKPGSLSGTMPTWTDLTSRAIGPDGTPIMTASRGRDYELTQPEAGQIQLSLDNHDGALNPQSTSSPFYPNVVPETPLRVSAVWEGRQYGLGYYSIDKVTQDFPERQWGFATVEASDAIGLASQSQMPSAYAGQVLGDYAYGYWTLGEFYNAPHGSLFSNLSRTSQKPMVGYSPPSFTTANGQILSTGQPLNLAGDPATGIGMTSFVEGAGGGSNPIDIVGASGAFVRDYGLPPLAQGVTLELWAAGIPRSALTAGQCNLLTAMGMPANYSANFIESPNGSRLAISVNYSGGNYVWQAVLQSFTGAAIINLSGSTSAITLNHVAVNVSASGSTWSMSLWANGNQIASGTGTYSGTMDWSALAVGPVNPTGGLAATNNWAVGQVAVYPWTLPATRIASHYSTGISAFSGDNLTGRLGKLFQGAALSSLPVGCTFSAPSPTFGPADQIQGQALADALYATSVEEGGMFYAPSSLNGETWYSGRTSLYNKASKAVFGDNGTSEIPYDPGLGFDLSNQFLFNVISAQRTISAGQQASVGTGLAPTVQPNSNGADAVAADVPSENQYMSRTLQQDLETTSDQDAFDRANWSLAKYRQPLLRANQIKVDCASNPQVFATMLGIEQGDVVTVHRRPIGYTQEIGLLCIVQKIEHQVGPNMWDVTLTLAPYYPESNVLQLDTSGFNVLGNNALAW